MSAVPGARVTGNRSLSTVRLDWKFSFPSTSSSSMMGMLTGMEVVVEEKVRVRVVLW